MAYQMMHFNDYFFSQIGKAFSKTHRATPQIGYLLPEPHKKSPGNAANGVAPTKAE